MPDLSPTSRALLALEAVQTTPGITATDLARRLGTTDRAVRRYVAILREAGIPIEAKPGRYGGYRVGRGFRMPPLMLTADEAYNLVMAILAGPHGRSGEDDPVGTALGKIIRVLPTRLATPAAQLRRTAAGAPGQRPATPDAGVAAELAQACAAGRRVRLTYATRNRASDEPPREMDVDPWAMAVRLEHWYLLCWSHYRQARRVLRVDRISAVHVLAETFRPPADLDPVQAIEAHLAGGWSLPVEIVIDAPVARVAVWFPRTRGELHAEAPQRTRLIGTTDEPEWYARRLLEVGTAFHIVSPPELATAARTLADRLVAALPDTVGEPA